MTPYRPIKSKMMSKVNNIAHRLVPLCLLLVALAGCRKEDTPAPDTPSGTPIAFTPETATKAAVSGVEDIQNDPNGFRVWGWFQGTTSGPMFGADGTQVTYEYDTTLETYVWTYSPTRYWMNGNYDFAAIYPAAITTGEGEAATTTKIAGTYAPATTGGTPVLTVPNFDATTQADLLVAFKTGINGLTHPDYVTLDFKHVLSNVQLRLTLDEDDFFEPTEDGGKRQVGYAYVSIVGFNNISTTGTLTASGSSVQWGSYGNGQMRLNYTDNPLQVTLERQDFFGEDGLLVIPQEFADKDGELYIRVVINNSIGSNSESITKEFKVPLASVIDEWLPNAKYIFEGVITQELMIEFNVIKVNNWQDEPLGGFIVN